MKYLLFLTLLTACGPLVQQEIRTNKNAPDGMGRFYDKDTDVVCYTYFQSAISCVKLDNK